jgi:RNA polymerase sigma-70 factor (ECF subfamily)
MEWTDQEAGFDLMPAEEKGKDLEYRVLLGKAIDSLPPKCREVFLLSRISDMSYKEIAAALGISQKTVENQLGKALKILRAFLKDKGVYLAWGMVNFFLQVHGG